MAHQILNVSSFQGLVSTAFHGDKNAMCWSRDLEGDFSEIIKKIKFSENIKTISLEELHELELSSQGKKAREIIIQDYQKLKNYGADPVLNIIKKYDRDNAIPFFSTDVYSFHVDRSPVPTATFLCTYYGESSEIVPNAEAEQKILIPEIRDQLKKLYEGTDQGFEAFLTEYFFDLHYQVKPNASIIKLGNGHLWRLAIDHPESQVLPCIHRAPEEKEPRLMIIC